MDLDMGCEGFERRGVDFLLDVIFSGKMVWFYR